MRSMLSYNDKIGRRLALYVILFSSLFTLLITAWQLYQTYERYISAIDSGFETVRNSQLPLMSNSVWSLNDQQVITQLDSLLQLPGIELAEVQVSGSSQWSRGQAASNQTLESNFELTHRRGDNQTTIGTLHMVASLDEVYMNLVDQLYGELISNGIKTFAVAIFMLALFHNMVTRHLYRIADHMEHLNPEANDSAALVLDRNYDPEKDSDALDRVSIAINNMQERLKSQSDGLVRANEKLVAALDQAHLANETQSKFLASMSHDLRTPLNAIVGFAQLMKRELYGPVQPAAYQEYVDNIHVSGEFLNELIGDVLDLSRIKAGEVNIHRTELVPKQIIDSCTKMLEQQITEQNATIDVQLDKLEGTILMDAPHLTRILSNLLSNSIKYSDKGCKITIEAERKGGEVVFKVSDNGIGISAEDLDHITEPFKRVDDDPNKPRQGTGLGLAIVKGLVSLYGGELYIESKAGKGTTVTFTIPQPVV